jgi:hypothetical protein
MRKGVSGLGLSETDLGYTPRTYRKSKRSLKGMVSVPILSTRSYKINKKECG